MTESPLDWADDAADEPADRKRQLMVVGGVAGVAVLAGAAFFLLHGSSSSNDTGGGLVAGAHHPRPAASAPAAAAPSAVPTAAVYHGAVGHDPFSLPDRIAAALAPPPPAASTAAASTTTPGSSVAGIGSVTVTPGSTPGSTGTTGTAQTPPQWLQLLAAHVQKDGSYNVDVRTAKGVFKNIKPGTDKIGGTFFSYIGDDASQGPHVYEFFAGESGGSLVPNASVPTYKAGSLANVKVLLSTLVYANHQVDGGVPFSG